MTAMPQETTVSATQDEREPQSANDGQATFAGRSYPYDVGTATLVRSFGEAMSRAQQTTGPAAVAARSQALIAGATQSAKDALQRQLDAAVALAAAKTPQDVMQVQIDYGRKAVEAWIADVARVSDMLTRRDGTDPEKPE